MKKLMVGKTAALGVTMTAVLFAAGCNEESKPAAESAAPAEIAEVKLESLEQKVTYIVGYNMASQAKSNGLEFDVDVITQAVQDVSEGKDSRIAKDDEQDIMMKFQEKSKAELDAKNAVASEENKKVGDVFLAENAKKEGVTVTESGLQYRVISAGKDNEGVPNPGLDSTVEVHYHGTLIDGTVFDSSVDRGKTVRFPVKGVIPGWTEALQLMKLGDKYELVIPSDLAYGEKGTSGKIGPNAVLVFEVELINIQKDQPPRHGSSPHSSPRAKKVEKVEEKAKEEVKAEDAK